MTSEHNNKDGYLDSLWDLDLDEPQKAPSPQAAPAKPGANQRDTLQPPVPGHEYVEAMMQLGDLDDPPGAGVHGRATAPRGVPGARAFNNSLADRLGLVMAPEDELLLPTDDTDLDLEDGDRPTMPAPEPMFSEAWRSLEPTPEPRRAAPPPPPAAPARRPPPRPQAAGFRAAPPRAAGAAPGGLPVPRAPSVPPPPESIPRAPRSAFEPLDPVEHPTTPAPVGPIVLPTPRAPSSGGLRLNRVPTPAWGMPAVTAEPETVQAPPPAPGSGPVIEIEVDEDEPVPESLLDDTREMLTRFEARNYGGALMLAETVLSRDPNHPVARRTADDCRAQLGTKYLASLGGRGSVPCVVMTPDEVRVLALDHRAGFLLSFIDGSMSIEEVLDVSSMPELDALRMMFELRQQGVIEIEQVELRTGRRG